MAGTSGVYTPSAGPTLVERCGCDDPTGTGTPIVEYVEMWAIDTTGVQLPRLLGTYEDGDFMRPYTTVNPLPECP
ncbi:hypothetical protein [Microtetraspora malaysiensis]|uniref:Uncharacterized protein n=1 Tax=Microtetraspora malaysiensis TaxID=161358 RepID=A0ABW6SKQ8_9ACTN